MSPRDASSRRGQCCGKRTIEFLFYQHIGALVCTTTLAIAVWLVIRHAHLETWETAHGWATSYRQMIILTKMYPKIHQYAHDGSLSAGDRRLLLDDIRFESRNFTSEHDEVHARDRERFRQLTNADTDAIQAWITAVDAFIKKAETPRVWMSAVRPLADAAICPSVVDPCEQALVKVMNLYTEAMYSIGEMRYDLAGMVFLALLCVLSIGQMFLVRAEYTQQLATIQLAEELASVIHDVRTPQQVIVSAVALLTQPGTADTTNAHDMVQIIADSCTATQRLLDTALLRIRSRAAPEPVPLAAFFKDISSVQSAACRDKGILWRCDLAPSACVSVFVDSDALLQIVSNLVSNAIRYTSKGHVSLQVSVDAPEQRNVSWMQRLRSSKHLHTLVVSVSDTGCGIPKHAMPLVFRKFHQVKSGTGFGIGLFTVARLTSSLRGGIDLWSEVGKGTRIVVRVPVVLVPSSATSEGDDNALMAPEPSSPDDYPPSLTARSITALNIILLDDDPVTLKLSKRILANAGHSVRTFSHGETLLEQYDDADVIVTDLNMSGSMSGFQVADRLRAIGYRGALIAHTGDRFAYNACLEHGFDALLPKPSSASTYVATIESVHQHKCSCPSS